MRRQAEAHPTKVEKAPDMKRPATFLRFTSIGTLLLSPIRFLLVFFAVIEWLNPVKSFIYQTGMIAS
jgi:hypothetical protein